MSDRSNGRLSADTFQSTLEFAQAGSLDSLGTLLESYRQYLLLIANQEIPTSIVAKVGASDLVQDTLAAAQTKFRQFRGATKAELRSWMRQILLNHLRAARRKYDTAPMRTSRRELSLSDLLPRQTDGLLADTSSPSKHFLRGELEQILYAALARLPDHYRLAIDLRHRQGLPFGDVARHLEMSRPAARKLWARAIRRLQKELRAVEVS